MKPRNRTTLVLGAGASVAMGYPVGMNLRSRILSLCEPGSLDFSIRAGLMNVDGLLPKFVDEFRRSQMYSIDAFLARRGEYSEIGKMSIASILLEAENSKDIFHVEHEDHWYRYLFNSIASDAWDDLNFSNLSVVTFNYDRSLEAYLSGAMKHAYNKSDDVVATKIKELKVVHVYGCLGSPFESDVDFLRFTGGLDAERVRSSASRLRVIPEGRDDDETLVAARNLISSADSLVFLGFGFDETNLKRLKASETCKSRVQKEGVLHGRSVYATCRGLTDAETMRAFELTGQHKPSYVNNDWRPTNFINSSCLELLKETLVLIN